MLNSEHVLEIVKYPSTASEQCVSPVVWRGSGCGFLTSRGCKGGASEQGPHELALVSTMRWRPVVFLLGRALDTQ